MTQQRGIVYLVGGGPGDPGLITVRGLALLRAADVVVHDRLIGRELLAEIKPGAEVVYAGKTRGERRVSQAQIVALLVDRAKRGLMVTRLKGGDPFIFGRGYEELSACRDAGVECVVIPGVSSAYAGPLAAGIPITERRTVRSFAVVTGMVAGESEVPALDYDALAHVDTLVILMGLMNLRNIARSLMEGGRDSATPAACIEWATTPEQRVTVASLDAIADAAQRDGLKAPVVVVVGEVAAHARKQGFGAIGPLAGQRIMVTGPRRKFDALTAGLTVAGANVISCPLVEVAYPESPAVDEAIAALGTYDWVVFASVRAVRGFQKRLEAAGLDARALAGCKVAAGSASAALALRRLGIMADLASDIDGRRGLTRVLARDGALEGSRVCYLRVHPAGVAAAGELRDAGAEVDDVVASRIVSSTPTESAMSVVNKGVDAVVLRGPLAVHRFVELGLQGTAAAVVCAGAGANDAARRAGLSVIGLSHSRSASSTVQAVVDHFQSVRADA